MLNNSFLPRFVSSHDASFLAPFLTTQAADMINKSVFYSLSFDGSNKGHKKMFPFVINYFTIERGVERTVIEVIELVKETADHITASLREVLQMNDINIQNMTSIGADNTNVNYGRIHSVFSLLKSDIPNLMKGVFLSNTKKYFADNDLFSSRKLLFSCSKQRG